MNKFVKVIALFLCAAMLSSTAFAAEEASVEEKIMAAAEGISALGGTPGKMLKDQKMFPAGTSGCDWTAIALALAGCEEYYEAYLNAMEEYVEHAYAEKGYLDKNKATEYHRIALTVLALGGDPTAFGKKTDGTVVDLIAEGTYNYAGNSLGTQGLNGWIWALIALDASGEALPSDGKYQREDIVNAILEAQEPEGGFGLVKGGSDVDITAMALQALAPYQNECRQEIDAALSYLAAEMTDTCGYVYYGAENAESAAQVVLALTALGIDPEQDDRFIRNGNTLLTEIDRFRQADGSYGHLLTDTKGDYLATAQTMFALIAVQRLRNGREWVFRFEDYDGPNQKETGSIAYFGIGLGVLVLCASGSAIMMGKRKKYGKANESDSK